MTSVEPGPKPASTDAAARHDQRFPASPAQGIIDPLRALAVDGIAAMYHRTRQTVAQTLRGRRSGGGISLRSEGINDRYAAIVALGLGRATPETQLRALAGSDAAALATAVAGRAAEHPDLGSVALAAWASAEVARIPRVDLFGRLARNLSGDAPIPTVICAWALTAALATERLRPPDRGRLDDVLRWSTRRLLVAQSADGLFPHHLPPRILGRWRAHVGCFADQVYPVQALARAAAATGRRDVLAAANRCASRICALQGAAGQWWWHYDVRDGTTLERYPVYSVHQHAMAPMALFDLRSAGGEDFGGAVYAGVRWLTCHPEVFEELIVPKYSVIWRKVGRREPAKLVRSATAVLSSYRIGSRVPWVDMAFPAAVVDHECRPYELGWLLYAWGHSSTSDGPAE